MARPKKVDPPIEKHIPLPTSIVAQVDLLLYSEVEQRVPYGAWSRLVERLLREWLDKLDTIDATQETPQ